jgi:hypothetical protein
VLPWQPNSFISHLERNAINWIVLQCLQQLENAITIFSAKGQFTYNIDNKEQLYYNDYNKGPILLECLQQMNNVITMLTTKGQLYYSGYYK